MSKKRSLRFSCLEIDLFCNCRDEQLIATFLSPCANNMSFYRQRYFIRNISSSSNKYKGTSFWWEKILSKRNQIIREKALIDLLVYMKFPKLVDNNFWRIFFCFSRIWGIVFLMEECESKIRYIFHSCSIYICKLYHLKLRLMIFFAQNPVAFSSEHA